MTIDGKRLSLKEVLIFFTAAEKEPPLGFPGQPTLTFLHGACDVLPTASTCSLTLRLPATHLNYEKFKDKLTMAVVGHGGFSTV